MLDGCCEEMWVAGSLKKEPWSRDLSGWRTKRDGDLHASNLDRTVLFLKATYQAHNRLEKITETHGSPKPPVACGLVPSLLCLERQMFCVS
jgi:hypothetical protein